MKKNVKESVQKITDKKLTLRPGPFRTKADTLLIERIEGLMKKIYALIPGQTMLVADRNFFLYWEYQYNPDKGETAKGEMRRWADALYRDRHISASQYVGPGEDRIEFRNELTTQLDAFIFLRNKFHEAYGFAEQPFGFLTHPKDAWALRMQIMNNGPDLEQFKVNGILIIESHSINEGEYCFVRK